MNASCVTFPLLCVSLGGGGKMAVCLCGSLLAKPAGGDAAKTNWTLFFLFFFFLLINLASVIITNFLISLWKKQLISMEMGIGESSRADDSLWIYSFTEPQLRWSCAEWLDGDEGKKTETNCDLWRLHISFTSYSVLGEIGILCGARLLSTSRSQEVKLSEESATWPWLRGPRRRAVTFASR